MENCIAKLPLTLALSVTLALVGCASTASLNSFGEKVQVRYDSKAPEHCRKIQDSYGGGATEDHAINNLRNISGENGANVVVITHREEFHGYILLGQKYIAYGTSYLCGRGAFKGS